MIDMLVQILLGSLVVLGIVLVWLSIGTLIYVIIKRPKLPSGSRAGSLPVRPPVERQP